MATQHVSVSTLENPERGPSFTEVVDLTDPQRLSVEPLISYLGPNWAADARERGMDGVEVGTLLRSLNRARVIGWLTPRAADRLAVIAAGVHPSAIWGAEWWSAADCGGPGKCRNADCCEEQPTRDRDRMCD